MVHNFCACKDNTFLSDFIPQNRGMEIQAFVVPLQRIEEQSN